MYPYNINARTRRNISAQLNKPKPPVNTMPENRPENNNNNGNNIGSGNNNGNNNSNNGNNNNINNGNNGCEMMPITPCPCDNLNTSQPVVNRYIIEMIKSALSDEAANADYYSRLSELVDCAEDKTLINKIHNEEVKHYNILSNIYYELTGSKPMDAKFEIIELDTNPANNFAASVLGKLESAAFYRKLLFSFLNVELRDWFTEIISDEQAHSQIMNYLYSKYN